MKKTTLILILALSLPMSAQAVIQNLNSQTGQSQTFSNDSNVGISSSGNVHTINWSGLLPVSRGGTGATSFATGTIPFIWNGIFSENNPNLFWDNTSNSLNALSVKIGDGVSGNDYPLFETDQIDPIITARGDFRLPRAVGSLKFTDNDQGGGEGEEWAGISSAEQGIDHLCLQGGTTGTCAILNFGSLSFSDKVFTFPNYDGTFGLLEADQTWTGNNTFSKGASATTTVNIGEIGDVTSHTCFNTKNTDGQDISFYFVGTTMVVENNVCR